MILVMLPPRPLSRLALAVVERADGPIGCPTCGEAMEAAAIHEVSIDRCGKHGVWFDAIELETALHRVGVRGEPPLEALAEPPAPWERPPVRAPHQGVRRRREEPQATPAPEDDPSCEAELALQVREPDRPPRVVRVRRSVVKLGRMRSAHVVLEGDDQVSRLHAVIEVNGADDVVVIDLGSAAGTRVNGALIKKQRLQGGDVIELGDTLLHVTIVPRPAAR
jgi:Zn-finger nucleic acid-binding protein